MRSTQCNAKCGSRKVTRHIRSPTRLRKERSRLSCKALFADAKPDVGGYSERSRKSRFLHVGGFGCNAPLVLLIGGGRMYVTCVIGRSRSFKFIAEGYKEGSDQQDLNHTCIGASDYCSLSCVFISHPFAPKIHTECRIVFVHLWSKFKKERSKGTGQSAVLHHDVHFTTMCVV